MLAIKKDKGPPRTRKIITNFQAFMPRACSVAPLLVASRTNFDLFGYTKTSQCTPLAHPGGSVQTHRGGGSMLSCAWRPPLARRVEA